MRKTIAILVCLALVLSGGISVCVQASRSMSSGTEVPVEIPGLKATVAVGRTLEEPLTLSVEIPADGSYVFNMSYKSVNDVLDQVKVALSVDGAASMEGCFPRMWMDHAPESCVDDYGNEYAAQQVPYNDYFCNTALSEADQKPLVWELMAGTHQLLLTPLQGTVEVESITFAAIQAVDPYEAPGADAKRYNGPAVVIEAEDALAKSSSFLVGKTDNASVAVTPYDANKDLINYIGGGTWKDAGDTIVWQTPELEAGYYQIGFSYRQNSIIGGKTYRTLTVDGKVPFAEAQAVGFGYDDNWQKEIFGAGDGSPYLIWLSEGSHRIALTVTDGPMESIKEQLRQTIADLGTMYMDISMITGDKVDIYRDYNLFEHIPQMQERLLSMRDSLTDIALQLTEITGQKNGSQYAVIMNMVEALDQMLENKYEAHRYKNYYYTNYCFTSSVLQDLSVMPLSLDRIVLSAENAAEPFEEAGWWEQFCYSLARFFNSFFRDFSGISSAGDANKSITIWVNWGRDQAQVLNALIERSFTPETGIEVSIKLTNASIIQATLSGDGPDCVLQMTRSDPVNLGMRGVLCDLTQFEDYEEILGRFQEGAELPYRYKDGLYAIPDTQNFYMMFYRTDVFENLDLKVPETWDEFREVSKLLMRNNMTVWMQTAASTSDALASSGVGSINVFPSMLMQQGLSLYNADGSKTTLQEPETMEVFKAWTDYYTKLKLPVTLDFYNRFRTGTTPLGIVPYTLYTTLKVTATEIDGKWAMTQIPGTVQPDGSVSHITSGSGTGCAILEQSENKDAAWEFLKWWTRADTQRSYSNDVESILGPTGRISLANTEALSQLVWDEGVWEALSDSWSQVQEIPEYPGSYYVSRSIYQSYWNVVREKANVKDVLMEFGKEANDEIARKWAQYRDRGN